jgi:lysine 2,3-aminomutase
MIGTSVTKGADLKEQQSNTRRWPWPDHTAKQWKDWVWQLQNSIRDLQSLRPLLPESLRRLACNEATHEFPFRVTPYYAKLIAESPEYPELAKLILPTVNELRNFSGQLEDPTGEEEVTPAPGLRHMYPDRVLYTLNYVCPCYCRFCFRRRIVGSAEGLPYYEIEKGLAYIKSRPEIREIILSGGEPFLLSSDKIKRLLIDIKSIPHIEVVRIHTKVPVFLPQRIDEELIEVLSTFRPIYININVCHPAELADETRRSLEMLADAGIPLGSQTPLLHGINDSIETMRSLMLALLKERVRPYYIHNCIPVSGSSHFRTHLETGTEIIRGLRGHISGMAVPTFSIFLSEAGGKVSAEPSYFLGDDSGKLVFKNYKGDIYFYPDTRVN